MAARGPDFRLRYTDALPASTADIGMTMAELLGLKLSGQGTLAGRVLTEALRAHASEPLPVAVPGVKESPPSTTGLKTVLRTQTLGGHTYYDAAGFPGRTLGLSER